MTELTKPQSEWTDDEKARVWARQNLGHTPRMIVRDKVKPVSWGMLLAPYIYSGLIAIGVGGATANPAWSGVAFSIAMGILFPLWKLLILCIENFDLEPSE